MTSIEIEFLDYLIVNNTQVMMYLINGVRLEGVIDRYDDNCLILKRSDAAKSYPSQLIYIHAIATICPSK
jgi:host factor-I protein